MIVHWPKAEEMYLKIQLSKAIKEIEEDLFNTFAKPC